MRKVDILIDGKPVCFDFEPPKYYANQIDKNFDVIEKNEKYLNDKLDRVIDMQSRIIDELRNLNDKIKDIHESLFYIAPEAEIIDIMAEDETERQMMYDLYMNHRNIDADSLDKYKDIVNELSGGDESEYHEASNYATEIYNQRNMIAIVKKVKNIEK